MRVKFINTDNYSMVDVLTKLEEVITTTKRNLERDTGNKVKDTVLADVVVTVGIIPEGGSYNEPQMLSVEHHEGYPEMFEWVIDMAEGKEVNNEVESFVSEQQVAVANGDTPEFEEVDSLYNAEHLSTLDRKDYGDMAVTKSEHKDGFNVMQYFKNDKLIQEVKLTPKEEEADNNG